MDKIVKWDYSFIYNKYHYRALNDNSLSGGVAEKSIDGVLWCVTSIGEVEIAWLRYTGF